MQLKPTSIKLGGAKNAFNCMIEGRPSRYVTNGGGRDTYIYHNDGGFSSPSEFTRKLGKGSQFENGLRNYRPSEKRFQKKKMSPEQKAGFTTFIESKIGGSPGNNADDGDVASGQGIKSSQRSQKYLLQLQTDIDYMVEGQFMTKDPRVIRDQIRLG